MLSNKDFETKRKNRKIDYCPRCGRPEWVGKESELVSCHVCLLTLTIMAEQGHKDITGKDIKMLRKELKLSVPVASVSAGVSKSSWKMMETGKRAINKKVYVWYQKNKAA